MKTIHLRLQDPIACFHVYSNGPSYQQTASFPGKFKLSTTETFISKLCILVTLLHAHSCNACDWLFLSRENLKLRNNQSETPSGSLLSYVISMESLASPPRSQTLSPLPRLSETMEVKKGCDVSHSGSTKLTKSLPNASDITLNLPGWYTLGFDKFRYWLSCPKSFLVDTSRQNTGNKMLR